MQDLLPSPPASFTEKKKKILQQLSIPDSEYTDASPKGSVDEGIKDLIAELNTADGIVTTSSCAGRVSVFVEGRKTAELSEDGQVAGVGGKGAGGKWLFVSHDPVPSNSQEWIGDLQLMGEESQRHCCDKDQEKRLIHFKFEPMILHVLTASPSHAQLVLRCALHAGFRESGAVSLTAGVNESPTPMVAVRSMGLGFESLIGQQVGEHRQRVVPLDYLPMLMSIANDRFVENTKRIERFLTAFRDAMQAPAPRRNPDGEEWEDAAARRERKRAEGLKRKAQLQQEKALQADETMADDDLFLE